jgi:hypothetical protein
VRFHLYLFVCVEPILKPYIARGCSHTLTLTSDNVVMTASVLLTEELATIVLCFSLEFAHFLMDAHLLMGAQHCHFRPVHEMLHTKNQLPTLKGLGDSVQTTNAALRRISRPRQRDIHDKITLSYSRV